MPLPVQGEHEPPADHVLLLAILLDPVPCRAELFGQGKPAVSGMLCNKLSDKPDIFFCDVPAPVSEYCLHGREYRGKRLRTQDLKLQFCENFSPLRGNLGILWIAVPDQKLQLMDCQRTNTALAFIRPPLKCAFG